MSGYKGGGMKKEKKDSLWMILLSMFLFSAFVVIALNLDKCTQLQKTKYPYIQQWPRVEKIDLETGEYLYEVGT